MKALDVIKQLHVVLPQFTDLFTDEVSVTSLSRVGITVTAITSVAHQLQTNDYVNIVSAINQNPLMLLELVGGYAVGTTTIDHDLTKGYQETVTVSGAVEPEYNGTFKLIDVPNRRKFIYEITGTPSTPATGSPILEENFNYGYNGYHQITVIDPVTFTYEITQQPFSPAIGIIVARHSRRISGAVEVSRALASYTKQNTDNMWMFAVIGDARANKSRYVLSDATDTQTDNTDFRQRIIQNFELFVFCRATQDLSGRYTKDRMEDLLQPILKSILGAKFPSLLTEESWAGVTFEGHKFELYNEAIYVHNFEFQTVKDITFNDTSLYSDISVAFRDIDIDYLSVDGDNTIMQSSIDLDDEPIT